MMKASLHRMLFVAQLVAALTVLVACSGGDTPESSTRKSAGSNAGETRQQAAALHDAFADIVPSTTVELRHFDAYEYYRGTFDMQGGAGPRIDAEPVTGPLSRDDADSLFSCFRKRVFK